MKYIVWTVIVWFPAILVACIALSSGSCANPNGCFGPSGGDIAVVVVFVLALPVWVLGLLVMLWWDRLGRWPR